MPLLVTAFLALAPPPVTLARKFKVGETAAYRVNSRLTVERTRPGLETALPSDVEIAYKFDYKVLSMKADGFAVLEYRRPSYVTTYGAEWGTGEEKDVENSKDVIRLTVSPLNEVTDLKVLPKGKKTMRPGKARGVLQFLPGGFDIELRRLALFVGSLDSALDFNPKFDFDEVIPGATWKKTVGYQPKKLAGKGDTQAVQRLDIVYTYDGAVTVNKKPFRKVTARLAFDNDLAPFIEQSVGIERKDSPLDKIPMRLDATIVYLLDPKTHKTMSAEATSSASYELRLKEEPKPVYSEKMNGTTVMRPVPTVPAKKR